MGREKGENAFAICQSRFVEEAQTSGTLSQEEAAHRVVWSPRAYRIIFRVEVAEVTVAAVIHGKRDLGSE